MLQEVKREVVLSEPVYHFSNDVTDTLGCILGAWWKDVVPGGFKLVFPVFFPMRKLSCSGQRTTALCEEGVRKKA